MPDIHIGKEYENAFHSICKLVEANCIDKSIVLSASLNKNEIVEQGTNNRYIFDSQIRTIENGNDVGMVSDGASWFRAFRNGEVDESNASWLNLIENVAKNYHQKYSFLEFQQKEEDIDSKTIDYQNWLIQKFVDFFYHNLQNCQIVPNDQVDKDNIYGVSLKIEIDGGTGEAEPVLCKVYFRQKNDKFLPILSDDATSLESQLYQIIKEDDDTVLVNDKSEETIDAVLNALETLIESGNFTESVILSSTEDKYIIEKLIERSADDITQLKCRSVNVFGISHVEWKNSSYYLKEGNRNILRFAFGTNNKMSIYCVNCGDELLVENNRFIMKEGFSELKKLNFEEGNFGFNNNEIKEVLTNSLLSDHLVFINCKRNGRSCSKLRCANQIIAFEEEGERKCKDCPYPEIITLDEKGRFALTRNLKFVNDLMQLVSNEVETRECIYCGRRFTRTYIKSGTCKLCSLTDEEPVGDNKVKASQLYKEYRNMIPFTSRIIRIFKDKYCYEDDEIIMFKLGETRFKFDKKSIKVNGLMSSPEKLK